MGPGPLTGRRVVTTRDEPGRLDSLLARAGADVVHVPLIAIAEPPDGGTALETALGDLGRYRWLIVTSRHGAQRVGAATRRHPELQLAAVGTRTADVLGKLAGRDVTIVPSRQTAAALVEAMPAPRDGERSVLVVQADRADDVLAGGLQVVGYDVTTVVGYVTRLRTPSAAECSAATGADAVAFASGSAAIAWVEVFGTVTPPVVVAIGPTTSRVATEVGLQVTHVAADHSVDGVAATIASVLAGRP